jgi:hypothetical protein
MSTLVITNLSYSLTTKHISHKVMNPQVKQEGFKSHSENSKIKIY